MINANNSNNVLKNEKSTIYNKKVNQLQMYTTNTDYV